VRNNIIYQTNECITEEGYQNSSVKMLPKGTVLIAMIGEGKTRGQSAILDIEATTNQNIAAIIIEHGLINPKFMWYWLQKQYRYNREKGAGSGPQALNCQRVRELEFIVPSIEEQNKIVEIIDIMMEKETQVSSEIEGTIDNILSIKKSILEKAFRGELGTNNPCDEPSIELLKQVIAND
jgi:type I restriction enzyme S subunit